MPVAIESAAADDQESSVTGSSSGDSGLFGSINSTSNAITTPLIGAMMDGLLDTKDRADHRQQQQQDALDQIQSKYAMQLDDYQEGEQEKYYNATTSPEAQEKRLTAAGLNPALIYGGGASFGGGSTQSGNVSGASASDEASQENATTNERNQLESSRSQGAGQRLTEAETKNTEQDTKKKEQETGLTNINKEIAKVNKEIQGHTWLDQVNIISANQRKAQAEATSAEAKGHVDDKTKETTINIINQNYAQAMLNALQTQIENKKLTQEEALKEFEATQAKMGVAANAPWYIKMIGVLAKGMYDNPIDYNKER